MDSSMEEEGGGRGRRCRKKSSKLLAAEDASVFEQMIRMQSKRTRTSKSDESLEESPPPDKKPKRSYVRRKSLSIQKSSEEQENNVQNEMEKNKRRKSEMSDSADTKKKMPKQKRPVKDPLLRKGPELFGDSEDVDSDRDSLFHAQDLAAIKPKDQAEKVKKDEDEDEKLERIFKYIKESGLNKVSPEKVPVSPDQTSTPKKLKSDTDSDMNGWSPPSGHRTRTKGSIKKALSKRVHLAHKVGRRLSMEMSERANTEIKASEAISQPEEKAVVEAEGTKEATQPEKSAKTKNEKRTKERMTKREGFTRSRRKSAKLLESEESEKLMVKSEKQKENENDPIKKLNYNAFFKREKLIVLEETPDMDSAAMRSEIWKRWRKYAEKPACSPPFLNQSTETLQPQPSPHQPPAKRDGEEKPEANSKTLLFSQCDSYKKRGAYGNFHKEQRELLRAERGKLSLGQMNSIVGERWRNLSEEGRQKYLPESAEEASVIEPGRTVPRYSSMLHKAYFLFVKMEKDKVKAENPQLGIGELMKKISARWKDLSKEEKNNLIPLAQTTDLIRTRPKPRPRPPKKNASGGLREACLEFTRIQRRKLQVANPSLGFRKTLQLAKQEWRGMTMASKKAYRDAYFKRKASNKSPVAKAKLGAPTKPQAASTWDDEPVPAGMQDAFFGFCYIKWFGIVDKEAEEGAGLRTLLRMAKDKRFMDDWKRVKKYPPKTYERAIKNYRNVYTSNSSAPCKEEADESARVKFTAHSKQIFKKIFPELDNRRLSNLIHCIWNALPASDQALNGTDEEHCLFCEEYKVDNQNFKSLCQKHREEKETRDGIACIRPVKAKKRQREAMKIECGHCDFIATSFEAIQTHMTKHRSASQQSPRAKEEDMVFPADDYLQGLHSTKRKQTARKSFKNAPSLLCSMPELLPSPKPETEPMIELNSCKKKLHCDVKSAKRHLTPPAVEYSETYESLVSDLELNKEDIVQKETDFMSQTLASPVSSGEVVAELESLKCDLVPVEAAVQSGVTPIAVEYSKSLVAEIIPSLKPATAADSISVTRVLNSEHFVCDLPSAGRRHLQSYQNQAALTEHIEQQHSSYGRIYACDHCVYGSTSLKVLHLHHRSSHASSEFSLTVSHPIKCQCGSKFNDLDLFTSHLHNEHPDSDADLHTEPREIQSARELLKLCRETSSDVEDQMPVLTKYNEGDSFTAENSDNDVDAKLKMRPVVEVVDVVNALLAGF